MLTLTHSRLVPEREGKGWGDAVPFILCGLVSLNLVKPVLIQSISDFISKTELNQVIFMVFKSVSSVFFS
jgi:hypothetical protein